MSKDCTQISDASQVAPANPVQVTDVMPSYGTIDFLELGKDVNEATTGKRTDFDFGDGYPGHAMLPALNFNSLSRIVSKYLTAAIGAGGQAVAVKPLIWEEDHGIAGMGPYRLFKAETPLGRFVYGTDAEGSAYYHTASSGVMMVGDEATAKRLSEASWQKAALAEVGKYVDLSALSQPHPADERVVEALRECADKLNIACIDSKDEVFRKAAQYALDMADAALSAKEGRKNG